MNDPLTIPDWVGIRPWKELEAAYPEWNDLEAKECFIDDVLLAVRLERERVLARLRDGINSFQGEGPHHFSEETRLVVIAALRAFASCITHAGVSKEESMARVKASQPAHGLPSTLHGYPIVVNENMPSDVPVEFTPIPDWAREKP